MYSNFDIGQMLNVINRHADEVYLTSNYSDWTLHVIDETRGEYFQIGTLFQVVVGAFKLYLDVAKKEREEIIIKLDGVPLVREIFTTDNEIG